MVVKKVLMIVYTFPPHAGGGVQRNLKFSRYLEQFSWEPIVVTVNPYQWSSQDYTLVDEIPQHLDVHRCYSLELRRAPVFLQPLLHHSLVLKMRRLFEIPDHCIGWTPFAMAEITKIIKTKKIDAIFSSFPPVTTHLVAYWTKKRFNLPWIADYRDPWTQRVGFTNRTSRIFRGLHKYLNRKCIQFADHTIVTTDNLRKELLNEYKELGPDKISTITNGYDEYDFKGLRDNVKDNYFTIVYTGITPRKDILIPFIRSLEKLKAGNIIKDKKIRFIIVGCKDSYGSSQDDKINGDGIEIVNVGYVSYRRSIQYLYEADVLLLFSWGYNIIPGKTFEYLRAKKPILLLADEQDEVAKLIVSMNVGMIASPDDVECICTALQQLLKYRISMDAGEKSALERYERKQLTFRLSKILNQHVKTK
jgi:glycosyltransferase involved in cell wall biosynthesis